MKNAGVFFSSLTCLVLAAHAHPRAHSFGRGHAHLSVRPNERARGCELEPFPLPPPATDGEPAPDEPGAPDQNSAPTPTPTPDAQEDQADLDVAQTPARVAPKAKMRVTVWAKNRGTASWAPKNVRIIVRWVDFEAGTRRRWNYNWIREVVPPMGQLRQPLDVPAPPRAGRYKVIYGLVRLPVGAKDGAAPSYNAPQDKWPGEFAAVAFAVQVGDAPATP